MEPATYSQIYIQVVFAVQGRQSLIHKSWEDELYKYATGIIRNKRQKLLAINGMPDHIHIFISMSTDCRLSDLIREIKKSTNSFINSKGFTKYRFAWQKGYGAFSYSKSNAPQVISYIENQKEIHAQKSFENEFKEWLELNDVEYMDKYMFDWVKYQ